MRGNFKFVSLSSVKEEARQHNVIVKTTLQQLLYPKLGVTAKTDKLNARCNECNSVFLFTVERLKKIRSNDFKLCPKCQRAQAARKAGQTQRRNMTKAKKKFKYTDKEYETLCASIGIKPKVPYSTSKKSTNIREHTCLVCKKDYNIDRVYVEKRKKSNRFGCSRCSGDNLKWDKQLYLKKLDDIDTSFTLKDKFTTVTRPTNHICVDCGYEKSIRPDNLLRKLSAQKGCPNCNDLGKYKKFSIQGKTFSLMGFEPQAMKYLVKIKEINISDIIVASSGKVPTIYYRYKGKKRHHPDFYLPRYNMILEVKSLATLGIIDTGTFYKKSADKFYQQVAKRNYAVKQGFNYRLYLMDQNGSRLKLPKDWYDYKFNHIVNFFKSSPSIKS